MDKRLPTVWSRALSHRQQKQLSSPFLPCFWEHLNSLLGLSLTSSPGCIQEKTIAREEMLKGRNRASKMAQRLRHSLLCLTAEFKPQIPDDGSRIDSQRVSSDPHAHTHTHVSKCNTKGHVSTFLWVDVCRCVWE